MDPDDVARMLALAGQARTAANEAVRREFAAVRAPKVLATLIAQVEQAVRKAQNDGIVRLECTWMCMDSTILSYHPPGWRFKQKFLQEWRAAAYR